MNRFFTLLFAASCLTAVGQSLSFDGMNDWVEAPSINLTGHQFNIEGWIKVPQVTFADQTNVIDNYVFGSGGSDRWGVYVGGVEHEQGQFAGQLYAPTFDIQPSENGLRIDDNQWHHFAVERNELGQSFLYIDGDLVNSGSSALNYNLNAGFPTRINGGYHCQGGTQCRFMTCVLADIQVSLSVKYESAFSPDCQITTASDAILHYSFNDMSSGVATDLSGSGNNGVIYGAYSSEEEPECVCSDTLACNYNDEEPCHYECHYCLAGTVWDEELQGCVPDNPSDLNHDGCVDVNDFMGHLAAFGGGCDGNLQTSLWQCGDPLEYQGYDYATVQIGEQCWFAENLRAENYRNGDEISTNLSDDDWASANYGASSIYGSADSNCDSEVPEFDACNEEDSFSEFGRLYNWYAVIDERGLCPDGWLVPADADWMILEMALGIPEVELNVKGDRGIDEALGLKSVNGWSDQNGDNSLGLSIKPSGARSESDGRYYGAGWVSYIWSSTQNGSQSWYRRFNNGNAMIGREDASPPDGLAVRCIKD